VPVPPILERLLADPASRVGRRRRPRIKWRMRLSIASFVFRGLAIADARLSSHGHLACGACAPP
jgi:hypothetical protein